MYDHTKKSEADSQAEITAVLLKMGGTGIHLWHTRSAIWVDFTLAKSGPHSIKVPLCREKTGKNKKGKVVRRKRQQQKRAAWRSIYWILQSQRNVIESCIVIT